LRFDNYFINECDNDDDNDKWFPWFPSETAQFTMPTTMRQDGVVGENHNMHITLPNKAVK